MHGDDERMAARLMFNFARTKQAAAAATLPGALGSSAEYVFDGTADKIAVEREECVQRMEAHTFLILARATEVWRGARCSEYALIVLGRWVERCVGGRYDAVESITKSIRQCPKFGLVIRKIKNVTQFSCIQVELLGKTVSH
jgi:hypothetical protein